MTTLRHDTPWGGDVPPPVLQALQRENQELREQLEQLLDWQDRVMRTLRNPKVSPVYRELYISLWDTYPGILLGEPTPVQIHQVRENAGWVSKDSATKFFADMQAIKAFTYTPGAYNPVENTREGTVTANLDVFPYPEYFDTKNCESRRRKREQTKASLDKMRAAVLILECERCASHEIEYGLVPRCKSCGHVHKTIDHIDRERITVTEPPETMEEAAPQVEEDGWIPPPAPPEETCYDVPFTLGKRYIKRETQVTGTIPRCKNWQCLKAPMNKTERTLDGYYCSLHKGYIDATGKPL